MERRPAAPRASSGIERGMAGAERGGGTHGSRSLLRRSRVCSGTARASRTPRPPCRRPPPRTRLWRQERHSALSAPQTGLTPHLPPGQHSQGIQHPAPRRIPPAPCGSAGQDPLEQSFRTQRMSVETPLWDPSLSITHRPCTPSRPASSRDSTRGRSGTCGTDRGCHPGLGDQGDIMASAKEKRSLPQC